MKDENWIINLMILLNHSSQYINLSCNFQLPTIYEWSKTNTYSRKVWPTRKQVAVHAFYVNS